MTNALKLRMALLVPLNPFRHRADCAIIRRELYPCAIFRSENRNETVLSGQMAWCDGPVAQWIERRNSTPKVAGSSPAGIATKIIACKLSLKKRDAGSRDRSRILAIANSIRHPHLTTDLICQTNSGDELRLL